MERRISLGDNILRSQPASLLFLNPLIYGDGFGFIIGKVLCQDVTPCIPPVVYGFTSAGSAIMHSYDQVMDCLV